MSRLLVTKLSALWIYLISITIIGNLFFSDTWRLTCEVLQIINMGVVIYLSIKIYQQMSGLDKVIIKWFSISNLCLILSAFFYFVVNYILKISDVNQLVALTYLIPSFLWMAATLVFWGKLAYNRIRLKNNWLVIIAILLTDVCLAFMITRLTLNPVSNISDQFLIFLIYTNIVSIFIFNLCMFVLICANKLGIKLLAAGAISIIGANILTSYIMYTYDPSLIIYRNDYWLFSSTIYISGLMLLRASNKDQIGNFSNESSIKNIITSWTLSIIVLTATLFLGVADYFHALTTQMLSVLPYFMFMYIILAVFISLFIAYIFEKPIKVINNTIRSFLEQPKEKFQHKIKVEEFAVLNDFLEYTQHILEERNEMQQKFRNIVDQVSHDIRSPIASLLTFAKSFKNLPEEERISLREIATRITDIADNLLLHYKSDNKISDILLEPKEDVLLYGAITQILSEKKAQYISQQVQFNYTHNPDSNFTFIKVEANSFKRMLSNLINNAVDAFNKKPGVVNISVLRDNNEVKISVQDNGHGMTQDVINKILNQVSFTSGKSDGHGIGLTQVRETLQRNNGRLLIDSKVGEGTTITLVFPQLIPPNWFADEIVLNSDDIVIVLDDDPSIHTAWTARFSNEGPQIKIKNFTMGNEALEFITALSIEEKSKVFLLSDFELLGQQDNGLNIIEKSGIKRSILVTSHHNNKSVQELVLKTNTKILPKLLAVDIPIRVIEKVVELPGSVEKVDFVFVDDDLKLVNQLVKAFFTDKIVDVWDNPIEFMENNQKYSLKTKICIDNSFSDFDISGLDIVQQLHEAGFEHLYLLSGTRFDQNEIPSYLTSIIKTDIASIEKLSNL